MNKALQDIPIQCSIHYANIAQKNGKLIASDKGFSMEELDDVDFISSMFASRRVNG